MMVQPTTQVREALVRHFAARDQGAAVQARLQPLLDEMERRSAETVRNALPVAAAADIANASAIPRRQEGCPCQR